MTYERFSWGFMAKECSELQYWKMLKTVSLWWLRRFLRIENATEWILGKHFLSKIWVISNLVEENLNNNFFFVFPKSWKWHTLFVGWLPGFWEFWSQWMKLEISLDKRIEQKFLSLFLNHVCIFENNLWFILPFFALIRLVQNIRFVF